jgi:hypothetical protein
MREKFSGEGYCGIHGPYKGEPFKCPKCENPLREEIEKILTKNHLMCPDYDKDCLQCKWSKEAVDALDKLFFDEINTLEQTYQSQMLSMSERHEKQLDELIGWVESKIVKRKPTHGTCCTCQTCGGDKDNCWCENNSYYEKFLAKLNELRGGE